jgi:hypothetical protein
VSGWTIIAVLMIIAVALWLSVRFMVRRSATRRSQRGRRPPRNGGGDDGTPLDGTALRIGRRDGSLEVPGPRPWASRLS